ncbi:hypothetical protein ACIRQO_37550 [Streptomyces anulatus]
MDTQKTPAAARYTVAAARARVIADIAHDRWSTPETMPVLRQIGGHLTTAAEHLDTYTPGPALIVLPVEACEALRKADTLAEHHPHSRFAQGFTNYVLAPLTGRELPLPGRLDPVRSQLGRREAQIAHTIVMLHADDEQQAEQPNAWIREVMDAWRTWVQLSAEVRVDNARPCNRRHP